MTLADFIEERIMPEPMSGCWLWIGGMDYKRRYGKCDYGGVSMTAHRAVYLLLRGSIPHGLHLDHLCRNRQCVNPAHVEPVTPRLNVLRGTGSSALRARATECVRGHAFTPENTYWRPEGHRDCRECQRTKDRMRRGQR